MMMHWKLINGEPCYACVGGSITLGTDKNNTFEGTESRIAWSLNHDLQMLTLLFLKLV